MESGILWYTKCIAGDTTQFQTLLAECYYGMVNN